MDSEVGMSRGRSRGEYDTNTLCESFKKLVKYQFKDLFLVICIGMYPCRGMCTCKHRGPQKLKEDVRSPGVRITGSSEPPSVDAGN